MITSKHTPLYLFVLISFNSFSVVQAQDDNDIAEITVTGTREETPRSETTETTDSLDKKTIDDIKPAHASELLNRIPGVRVNVTVVKDI